MKKLPELDDASRTRARQVAELPRGAHLHLSGICGTGMAAVAVLLKEQGFRVTGSDKAFYPPMGDLVRFHADKLYEGYSAENFQESPALVVIGNSLSRGNPEVEYVLEHKLPFASMPEVLAGVLIGAKSSCGTSVVVAGTHGKTTTTSMIATLLEDAGRQPGFFIGGMPTTLPTNIRMAASDLLPEERIVVLEGDEYDSAFFAKWPKFHSYRPDIAVMTSLEFDHADIYESVEQIEIEFTRLARRVPATGAILVCAEAPRLVRCATEWARDNEIKASVVFYGEDKTSSYQIISREMLQRAGQPVQRLTFALCAEQLSIVTPEIGRHNALNLLATAAVGKLAGVPTAAIKNGLEAFRGVKRRQSIEAVINDIVVMEDFAHHPSAVHGTLEGLRESYPERRIVAVFEPRSNTSRRSFFQREYEKSFHNADLVVIKEVTDAGGYSGTNEAIVPLDVHAVKNALKRQGVDCHSYAATADIFKFLVGELKSGDLVVLMSNGDFDGLLAMLIAGLERRSRREEA